MKLTIALTSLLGAASAFAPASQPSKVVSLRMAEETIESEPLATPEATAESVAPTEAPINGWVADSTKPCYGLPGAISPLGFFDPLGFTKDKSLSETKRIREAEVMHGRVAMMAVIGYLIAENTPTIAYGMKTGVTIANNQIPEVPGTVLFPFFLLINICEAFRANKGWVEPGLGPLFSLRESYYPGDLGFDPLGFKPKDATGFANMQAKELSNGRLAMLAASGFMAQELATNQPILSFLS